MKSFKQIRIYLSEAGENPERQERGFVNAINAAVKQNGGKPISIKTSGVTLNNVLSAEKYSGRSSSGTEPYTDVVIKTKSGIVNLSMKGSAAPSLAGGGLVGIEMIIPGLGDRFFKAAHTALIKKGFKTGDKIPDVYGKLNDKDKLELVVGTSAMGGPINYMYIGPMDVVGKMDRSGVLDLNGGLYEVKKYAKEHELYFRLRARREDQTFDSKAVDKKGTPKVYGKSPSKGDSAGRLVVTDKPSSQGLIITF